MKIDLIVLRSKDIQKSKDFYEDVLGLSFLSEKHGIGPEHFSTNLNGTILEIYPEKKAKTEGLRLGFRLEQYLGIKSKLKGRDIVYKENKESILITDPDGHKIEIRP